MTPPKRQLGLSVAAAIVIANMIGTGVFTSTGFQANSLHDPMTILLAWIVGGVIALCGAAVYAELAVLLPRAGGEYVYLSEAYHPAVGFMSGWVSLTAGFSAPIAAAAIAFAAYVGTLIPGFPAHDMWSNLYFSIDGHTITLLTFGPVQAIAIALIAVITLLHAFDTKVGGWVQAAFTAAKVLLIVVFIVGGLLFGKGDWSHFDSQAGGFTNVGTSAFAIALMYVSLAYSGWNAATYIAGEIERPEKTLPRALLLGTGIVMVLYVLLNVVFFYAVPSSTLAGPSDTFDPVIEVGSVAARNLFGDSAGQMLTSVIALALVSAVSAMVMAGPRVYAAMAANRALPHQLNRYSKRGVPTVAVVTQGVLATLFVLVGDLGSLMRFVAFTLSIFAALTVGALFILRKRGLRASYQTPLYPIPPIVFIALSAWIAYNQVTEHPLESAVVGLLLAVGGVVYLTMIPRGPLKSAGEELPTARVVTEDTK
jgi:APA family basic amino acid/polyamine antiporter